MNTDTKLNDGLKTDKKIGFHRSDFFFELITKKLIPYYCEASISDNFNLMYDLLLLIYNHVCYLIDVYHPLQVTEEQKKDYLTNPCIAPPSWFERQFDNIFNLMMQIGINPDDGISNVSGLQRSIINKDLMINRIKIKRQFSMVHKTMMGDLHRAGFFLTVNKVESTFDKIVKMG